MVACQQRHRSANLAEVINIIRRCRYGKAQTTTGKGRHHAFRGPPPIFSTRSPRANGGTFFGSSL